MYKLLIAMLLLVLPAVAKPSWPFKAKFDRPPSQAKEAEGTAWAWEKEHESQLVYQFKERRTLGQLKEYLRKSMPPTVKPTEESQAQVGGYPAVVWGGLNDDGVPFLVLMVSTPRQSFLCGSVTYDMAHNRQFIRSFTFAKP
ncbi:hypothetical protein IV102_37700 [bacterium]|nr:hypothetical protein [bacterium]